MGYPQSNWGTILLKNIGGDTSVYLSRGDKASGIFIPNFQAFMARGLFLGALTLLQPEKSLWAEFCVCDRNPLASRGELKTSVSTVSSVD